MKYNSHLSILLGLKPNYLSLLKKKLKIVLEQLIHRNILKNKCTTTNYTESVSIRTVSESVTGSLSNRISLPVRATVLRKSVVT